MTLANDFEMMRVSSQLTEETDGKDNAADQTHRQTRLGSGKAFTRVVDLLHVLLVVNKNHIGNRGQDSNSHCDERKAADALVPVTTHAVDDGESAKQHVEDSVDNGVVEGQEQDDRFAEQKDPGALETSSKRFSERDLACVNVDTGSVNLSGKLG